MCFIVPYSLPPPPFFPYPPAHFHLTVCVFPLLLPLPLPPALHLLLPCLTAQTQHHTPADSIAAVRINLSSLEEGGGLLRIFLETVLSNETAELMPTYFFQPLPYAVREK